MKDIKKFHIEDWAKNRLYPNKTQQKLLQKHFGATRYIYNRSLALKKYAYQKFGIKLSATQLINCLPKLKKRHSWLKEIDSQALQQSIRHLDEAFKHFFRRVKSGETPGFPKFKSKKYHKQNFQYPQRVKIKGNKVYLPKIGWIKAKGIRYDLIGKIKTVKGHTDTITLLETWMLYFLPQALTLKKVIKKVNLKMWIFIR